jgi:hypothetical protein
MNTFRNERLRRHSMILVRRREGVFPSGQPEKNDNQNLNRVVHVVLVSSVAELREDDITSDMTNRESWVSCCGVEFAPYTIELVDWGTGYPHKVCVSKAGYPETFVSRMHREARDVILGRTATEEDITASIATLDRLFANCGRDWIRNEEGDGRTYEASFNGVFSGDRLFPRGIDLGLQYLHVELLYPGEVHLHSCGIRDGCSRHLVRTETLPLNDPAALQERISSLETAAEGIQLEGMIWCLFTGDCSVIPLYVDP